MLKVKNKKVREQAQIIDEASLLSGENTNSNNPVVETSTTPVVEVEEQLVVEKPIQTNRPIGRLYHAPTRVYVAVYSKMSWFQKIMWKLLLGFVYEKC